MKVRIFLDEDKEWGATFVKLPNVSGFGVTVQEALDELAIAYEAYKVSCDKVDVNE